MVFVGLRQREIIVQTFIEREQHITAEDLHLIVRDIDNSVSAATVYRTLNMLVDIGLVQKRHFNENSASFDLVIGKGHHHHLIDVDDGKIIEFNDPELEKVLSRVAADLGYEISCHKLELFCKPKKD